MDFCIDTGFYFLAERARDAPDLGARDAHTHDRCTADIRDPVENQLGRKGSLRLLPSAVAGVRVRMYM